MILQALTEYYDRKANDPVDSLAPPGFEWKPIPFIIEITDSGEFLQLEDTREQVGKKKVARSFLVPQTKIRSGVKAYESPNVLWDHYGFVLGYAKRAGKDKEPLEKDAATALLQHEYFFKAVESIFSITQDKQVGSVLKFLESKNFSQVFESSAWDECSGINGCNLSFRVQCLRNLVCQSPNVIEFVTSSASNEDVEEDKASICLVTGELSAIERLHPAVSGVGEKPAPFSAVNDGSLPAFASFGKHQGFNFPVSKQAAFAYSTALNHLLKRDGGQRMQVGDASTVFWAEKKSGLETGVVNLFGESPKDDPDANVRAVEELFKSVKNGRYVGEDKDTRFYVLGLAPNAARIAVRFWHVSTVGQMAERFVQHFEDLKIVHGPKQPEYLSLFRLLVSTASLGKADNIPPNLAGDVMRAILEGRPYPQTLLGAAIRRIKAEQDVSYPRAMLIKACINRSTRNENKGTEEELKVSLDENNTNIGYRLGRLFAVLEKAQEEANPGINATIRDRYYGSASSSPVTAFSTLMKLSKHHIAKLGKGRAINLERLIGEVLAEVQDFPAHLNIADQGRFAIGYYHQRQNFFKKSEEKEMIHE
ncbi:MAG: type I-C CRISPR-associated protein Cas8c/Csd1 [Zetaproteobacteria bacterium]|nr:type I-C CRISPR-associated protein Cas8c/Csd1 [Zetaproteobacteria bacterium]